MELCRRTCWVTPGTGGQVWGADTGASAVVNGYLPSFLPNWPQWKIQFSTSHCDMLCPRRCYCPILEEEAGLLRSGKPEGQNGREVLELLILRVFAGRRV